jgi:hypothetical protein
MNPTTSQKSVIDWLTAIAIAAIATSLTVAFHEGIHALSCAIVGGDLQEYSALHVECAYLGTGQGKIVSGSASIANLILGVVSLVLLRRSYQKSTDRQFFLWLFMLMNWLNGAGYWMFSGIANLGDWAQVIAGWDPHWLWRVLMTVLGTAVYLFVIWFSLHELGKIIGGDPNEQIGRANKLGLLSYAAAALVIVLAGLFNPYGLTSLPVVAGLLAVLGGMSPLVWMMQWFQAKSFAKLPQPPLAIPRQWPWIVAAVIVVFAYSFILGRTLYF